MVEFEAGRRIAWTHLSRVLWRYEIDPLPGGGCRVTETWDPTGSPAWLAYRLLGFPGRTQQAITATLRNLKAAAESVPTSSRDHGIRDER